MKTDEEYAQELSQNFGQKRAVMKIVKAYPPNIDNILKVFPLAKSPGVIFAWGDTIFNPDEAPISRELMAHETTHGERQRAFYEDDLLELGIDAWWYLYLNDKQFCFNEELHAHRAEYKEFCKNHSSGRDRFLTGIANRLASPLYGSLCTPQKAKTLIRNKFNL